MRRNFYLQHSLMAMHDPRMQNLLDKEGPKGIGAYWIIIEKMSMLPDSSAQLEYLQPYCKKRKLSFAYLKKIILEFQLFKIEEDGSFSPAELNPMKKNEQKAVKNDRKNVDSDAKKDEKHQKTTGNKMENQTKNQDNTLKDRTVAKTDDEVIKENIKDITTAAAKEKETAATDDDNDNSPSDRQESLTVCDDFGQPQPPLRPFRPWQELVNGLAERTPWLEAACMQTGYGELLMRHIKEAVSCFRQHIEVYDKWHDLLTESDARRYFVNFVSSGKRTSQALYVTLLALDDRQQSAIPPDPYRYEQLVNGRRTYLGCPIPDNAPPRPDATAFWNETTHSWSSQNTSSKQGKRHT